MTRVEAEKALQATEAQQVTANADWKAWQGSWRPEWQQHVEANRFRPAGAGSSAHKRPATSPADAAFQVEEARRQLAAIDASAEIDATRRAAAKVDVAKAKVDLIVADAERKLALVREEFIAALQEFGDLWKLVPEAARDLLPMPFCVASPYVDGCIVRTIKAVGT
jgi:hypothetical protein